MKALDTVKNLLGWGPKVAQQLQRVEAIDERLMHIAARQAAERRLVPEAEHAAAIVDWIRRKRAYYAAPREKGVRDSSLRVSELLLPLGQPTPREPHLVDVGQLEALVFVFLGELMEAEAARVVAEIAAHEITPRGRPAAERPEILARLAEERTQLIAERAELVDQVLAASGGTVTIAQLEETQHERDAAARTAKQAAEKAATEAWARGNRPGGISVAKTIIPVSQRGGPADS